MLLQNFVNPNKQKLTTDRNESKTPFQEEKTIDPGLSKTPE